MEENALSNFFGDEDGAEEAKVEAEAETEATEESTESTEKTDEKAEESSEEKADPKAKESSSDSDSSVVPLAALTGEREKRQEAQRRAEAAERELESLKKTDRPSVFEDEKGFAESLQTEIRTDIVNERLNMSEALAVREFGREKVDQAKAWFKETASRSPMIVDRFRSAPLQYHEVVDMYSEHLEIEKMKDLPAYKEQLRAEVEAEVKSKLEAELKEKQDLRDSIPTSLAGEASKEGLKGSSWKGPTPDEEIYND